MAVINETKLKPFRFWCQKVLPLVYDNSLSYYEILCKVVDYLNKVIEDHNTFIEELAELEEALAEVQHIIDTFDTEFANRIISEHLATMIFVEITSAGYFVYHIPNTWNDIEFNTTGLDITLAMQPEYGHLVLSY